MATEKLLDFAMRLRAIDEASASIQKVAETTKTLGEVASAVAESAAFAAIAEGMHKVTEAAAAMQSSIADVAAATGIGSEQLEALKRHAEDFAAVHFSASAEEYTDAWRQAYQTLHNFTDAQKAADDALRLSDATGISYSETIQLITSAHENLAVGSTEVVNVMAAAQRQFAMSRDSAQQTVYAVARMSSAAKIAHSDFADLTAIAGEAQMLLPGGRGAQLMASIVSKLPDIAENANLDLSQGLFGILEQVRARTEGLDAASKIRVLADMHIDKAMGAELLPLLDNVGKMRRAAQAIREDNGAALSAEQAARAATFGAQVTLLAHSWEALKNSLGTPMLQTLTNVIDALKGVSEATRHLIDAYPWVGKIVFALGSIGLTVTGIAAAGWALKLLGSGLSVFSGLVSYVKAGVFAIRSLELATKALTAAQWLYDAAAAFGFGWIAAIVAGAVVLGVAAYEVYKHWDAIKKYFGSIDWKGLGASILMGIANGMTFGLTAHIIPVLGKIGSTILGHFKGHSPPPLGPLHQLGQVNLIQTIAETFKPAPVLAAIRRVAAVTMVAAPMMIAPAVGAMAGPMPGGSSRGVPIVINITYAPVIPASAASRGDLEKELRSHARTLADIVEREIETRGRVRW